MQLAMLLLIVFLLTGYAFACGWEIATRMFRAALTPCRIIEPGFRVIWHNPRIGSHRRSN